MADGSLGGGTRSPEVKDPTRDLLDKLEEAAKFIKQSDPKLAKQIEWLTAASQRPGQIEDAAFRTRVAYIVQDTEKHSGPLAMSSGIREEMTRLAGSFPGLQNDRVGDLLKTTPGLESRDLIRDIRTLAADTVKAADQKASPIESQIDALENRSRLESAPEHKGAPKNAGTTGTDQSKTEERVNASPGGGDVNARQQDFVRQPGTVSRLLSAVRPDGNQVNPNPWDKPPTPMTERHASFRETMQNERDEKVLKAAEVAGVAAVEAMRAFANGPGGSVMARINDAAKSDPRGLTGVFAEMREGGRYEGLSKQFQGEREFSKGFAESHDKAVEAVTAFGRARGAAEAVAEPTHQPETALGGAMKAIGLRLPENASPPSRTSAEAIGARFEKLDAEVGKSAAGLPGSKEGKSMTEELGEKIKAVVEKAVEAVRSLLNRDARQEASASPSPGM